MKNENNSKIWWTNMNNRYQVESTDSRKMIINHESITNSSTTYKPSRIVMSSAISRKNVCNIPEAMETKQIEELDAVDDLFQNLSKKMIYKIKEDKDHLKLKLPLKKKKSFLNEFLEVKKHFETDFTTNTRIYQNASQLLVNREQIPDLNDKEYKLQVGSSDKYIAMLDSCKSAQKDSLNIELNKLRSSQSRNWVPGAVMTKMKINSNSNCNASAKNEALNLNSLKNNQETKIRERNGTFYTFTYTEVPSKKETKSKKRSFIEEFCELKDRLGVTSRREKQDREENSPLFNIKMKQEDKLDSSPMIKKEYDKINNKLITPFSNFNTTFFSDFKSTDILKTENISNKNLRQNTKNDITANWVKGELIERRDNVKTSYLDSIKNREQTSGKKEFTYCASPKYFLLSNESDEGQSEKYCTPKNGYSKVSPRYTPDDEGRESLQNERLFQNQCTSAITMANSVQYSKNEVVITQTKVTKLTVFPSYLENVFRSRD